MSKVSRPRTAAERKERLYRILDALSQRYPNVTCALNHSNAWELLVATILSAQCTDARVNMVTPELFRRFPTMQDLAVADVREVSEVIRSTGFFNNKAKSIIGAARTLIQDFGGEIPRTIEQLLTVPGAARKTSNVVLGTAFGIPSGVVVDTHVGRIALRLDLTKETNPVKVEQDLMKILPQDRWILFSHQVIHFGREICVARKPRCGACPLEGLCYAKDKAVL
ncbi:MAG: endonuclease III [Acidobacteria bacterium]|nr:endonuclease III [Acidobacteriota bacterium]